MARRRYSVQRIAAAAVKAHENGTSIRRPMPQLLDLPHLIRLVVL